MIQNSSESWPLVLSTEVTIPSQTMQVPPQLALMNPTGEAFKIHEIRFSLKSTQTYLTGGTMACKLDLGRIAITNGFVPVWNFGRVISYDQDLNCQYSWKLQHPLQIAAGGFLAASFQNLGQLGATITARITYFASTIDQRQASSTRRIFLPYVSAYIGKAFPWSTADSDTSSETDLLNPFDSDLRISRLIGRFNVFLSNTQINASRFGARLLSVRASLSNGDPLIRTLTPFQQAFGEDGRAWEQRNTVLKPHQYFQIFVDKAATTDTSDDSLIQPYVSLVGYREVQLSEGLA
jgi:hypothetical protein